MTIDRFYKEHHVWLHRAVALAVLVGLLVAGWPSHPGTGDLPAFNQQDVAARKRAFFDYLRPIAQHHNARIAEDRVELMELAADDSPGWLDRRRIRKLARKYRIDMEETDYADALTTLLRRVDVVPESLVLVQAAKESAWGRSRFAREGNALFGEWCFNDGCGMVPGARGEGRAHEVEAFDSVYEAVGSYMRNLNTHPRYIDMRVARQLMRQNNEEPTGLRLAQYLGGYSERGDAYVREVRSMIRNNDLETG